MLIAYLDESGYGDKDIIVIGGFFGSDLEWSQCETEWKKALGKRKGLHMKELRWGTKKLGRTKTLLKDLGPIPHQCGLVPAWARLRVSDYADLVEDTAVSRKIQCGYFLGAQYIALVLLEYMRLTQQTIKIVFEYNEHFAQIVPAMLQLYGEVFFRKSDGASYLSGVELVTKDSTCLTQPADYLTYARLQQLRDRQSVRAKLCMPILEPQPGIYVDVSRSVLRKLMSSPSQKHIQELGRELEPHIQRLRKFT